jgi:hypothetical protein
MKKLKANSILGRPATKGFLSSFLLSKHTMIKKKYRTIILPLLVQIQNLVSHFLDRTKVKDVTQKGAEEDIRPRRKEVTICFMLITKYSCD